MKAVVLDGQGRYVRDCAVDEVGVLVLSGPNVFSGYRSQAHDAGLWLDCGDGKRWLNTGDLGRQDADGYFWLTGRRKELIIRSGHNIDPAMIEDPLHRHPAVQTAAAIARPDAYAGELPVAYVQLKPGAKASEEELLEFLRGEVAERAALPKRIRILDIMPLTPIGKIYKPALKRREAEDALRAALDEAGVAVRELRVEDDKLGGLVVYATPDEGVAPDDVRQVLERFPLGVRLQ
jgi:fatty-acyl-CoA synthase